MFLCVERFMSLESSSMQMGRRPSHGQGDKGNVFFGLRVLRAWEVQICELAE